MFIVLFNGAYFVIGQTLLHCLLHFYMPTFMTGWLLIHFLLLRCLLAVLNRDFSVFKVIKVITPISIELLRSLN